MEIVHQQEKKQFCRLFEREGIGDVEYTESNLAPQAPVHTR